MILLVNISRTFLINRLPQILVRTVLCFEFVLITVSADFVSTIYYSKNSPTFITVCSNKKTQFSSISSSKKYFSVCFPM